MLKRLGGGNIDYVGRLQELWPVRGVGRDAVVEPLLIESSNWDKFHFCSETLERNYYPNRCYNPENN